MQSQSPSLENPSPKIGCAGWSIPGIFSSYFPVEGSHLARYSLVFNAVEINSSFYHAHKPATYERWRNSVPTHFRFSVKVPRLITHSLRLKKSEEALAAFLSECAHLRDKLGALLVQLPPSLAFEESTANAFFETLRSQFSGDVGLEPRHATWFTPAVDILLSGYRVARVAADPPPVLMPEALLPGGWGDLMYYRLHGSPRIYYSEYTSEYLGELAQKLAWAKSTGSRTWCIFDNTAEGAATGNALNVMQLLNTRVQGGLSDG